MGIIAVQETSGHSHREAIRVGRIAFAHTTAHVAPTKDPMYDSSSPIPPRRGGKRSKDAVKVRE